jgi:hypothetical protein
MRRGPAWQRTFQSAALLVLGATISPAISGGTRLLSVRELATTAQIVVLGKVESVVGEWNSQRTNMVTRIALHVHETLKGTVATDRLSVVQPGGQVGSIGSVVGDTPSFTVGQRVVLFLTTRRDGEMGIIALFQGRFDLEQDASTGVDVAVRHAPGSQQVLDRIELDLLRSEVRASSRE